MFYMADSIDTNKRNFEAGYQLGHKKRNKEVIAWAKKRKRSIRRDELISHLSGRSPPSYQRGDSVEDRPTNDIGPAAYNPLLPPVVPTVGFNGWSRRRSSQTDTFEDNMESREYIREARKRSLSTQDVVMDSSLHKKCKFL